MSKIVCDICGTTYPDTADCCPICGCSRDSAMDFLGEVLEPEEPAAEPKKGRFASKSKKEIFDYDEVNSPVKGPQTQEEETADEDEENEEPARPNTFVIIALTLLIAILLLFAGFLAVRYILPNLKGGEAESAGVQQSMEAVPSTSSSYIPCQNLVMSNGAAQLSEAGQYFLLNITPSPADTSDLIVYASADENVATVTQDGRITAVGEGETVVFITCGNLQLKCPVTVSFQPETLPPTEAPTTAAVEEEPEDVAEEPVDAAEAGEDGAYDEDPAQDGLKDVTLKLKKTDIMLGVYYEYRLALDCDLDPSEVEWSVEHPHIASVDDTGLVKALKSGTTAVIARYGDQEVKCLVRCG